MKFSFLTKMTAFALLATGGAVAAEEPKTKLRGPVVVSLSDIDAQAATSKNAKVSHSSSRHHSTTNDNNNKDLLPDFFPTNMTPEQITVYKETAAQKRQRKRDDRREDTNPDRTQDEENRERERKTDQSRSRGDRKVDPYNGNKNDDDDGEFGRRREAGRTARCDRNGRGCRYSTPNQECYRDCTDEGYSPRSGWDCAEYCRYMDPECYDDCRADGDGIVQCLDDCGENIDRNSNRNSNRVDCAEEARDCGRVGSRAYQKCFDRCDGNDNDDRRREANDRADCADFFCRNEGRPGDRSFENCMDENCRSREDRTIDGQRNCREEFCGDLRPGNRNFEKCMDRNCRDAAGEEVSVDE